MNKILCEFNGVELPKFNKLSPQKDMMRFLYFLENEKLDNLLTKQVVNKECSHVKRLENSHKYTGLC